MQQIFNELHETIMIQEKKEKFPLKKKTLGKSVRLSTRKVRNTKHIKESMLLCHYVGGTLINTPLTT